MNNTQIKSFEDACKVLNIEPTLPDFSVLSKQEQKAMLAHYKLVIIARALNGDWKPDWNNSSQYKYYPWFNMKNGFSYYVCVYDCQYGTVGSRLCFCDSETAIYAGKTFLKLYKDYFTYSK